MSLCVADPAELDVCLTSMLKEIEQEPTQMMNYNYRLPICQVVFSIKTPRCQVAAIYSLSGHQITHKARRKFMRRKIFAGWIVGLLMTLSQTAFATSNDIKLSSSYTQANFDDLSRQVGLAISYTPLAPAAPLGLLGFDIGVEATAVQIDEKENFWIDAVGGKKPSSFLFIPKIHAQKGLPLGFDVGLFYGKAQRSNIGLMGGELKWAILKGTLVTPAVAIRGNYTELVGVNDIDMKVYGADVSVSKGFAFITPYAGIGQVWISSQEKSGLITPNFKKASLNETKGFLGVKLSFFVISVVAEADFSKVPSYSGRLNLSF